MASTLPRHPIFDAVAKHDPESLAIVHSSSGRTFKYGSLLRDVASAKDRLKQAAEQRSLDGERVAFLAQNGYDYVGMIGGDSRKQAPADMSSYLFVDYREQCYCCTPVTWLPRE